MDKTLSGGWLAGAGLGLLAGCALQLQEAALQPGAAYAAAATLGVLALCALVVVRLPAAGIFLMALLAGAALGATAGGSGRSGGCGIDVTTRNPRSCGTRRTSGGGSNGLRPPYYCIYEGEKIVTNTYSAGCWMVEQDNTTIPMR